MGSSRTDESFAPLPLVVAIGLVTKVAAVPGAPYLSKGKLLQP
jgi:hypothetical protein